LLVNFGLIFKPGKKESQVKSVTPLFVNFLTSHVICESPRPVLPQGGKVP